MATTALFTLYRGSAATLSSSDYSRTTHDGRMYLTTDDGYLYYDVPDSSNQYGVTASIGTTRKYVNAGTAKKADSINSLTFSINEAADSLVFTGGNTNNHVYIGTSLIATNSASATSQAAVSGTGGVYVNLLTLTGNSSSYSVKNSLKLVPSKGISITCTNGNVVTIEHTNSAIGASTLSASETLTPSAGSNIHIPLLKYDSYGHIIAEYDRQITLPSYSAITESEINALFA